MKNCIKNLLFKNPFYEVFSFLSRFFFLSIVSLILIQSIIFSFEIERRREQLSKDSTYFIVPVPYSLPGIGNGLALSGYVGNVFDTYTDVFGVLTFGDVEGRFANFQELYVIPEHLYFQGFYGKITKASSKSYSERGMDSDPEEFQILESSNIYFYGFITTLSFWEKMLEFAYSYNYGGASFDRILDKDGDLIIEGVDEVSNFQRDYYQILVDYTDDSQDPRKGVRFDVTRENYNFFSEEDEKTPKGYTVDYNLTFYIPVGRINTFAINYYQSDSFITQEGETNLQTIEENLNINCSSISDAEKKQQCEKSKTDRINETYANNKYGTASNLGGSLRLRGYEQNRFRAAHQRFYGGEFRWNLNDETTPFDFFFIKDIKTAFQFAFFYEAGTSADKVEDLGKIWKSSYGTGVRVVGKSGFIYRFEIAFGDEGNQFIAFYNYPWEGF